MVSLRLQLLVLFCGLLPSFTHSASLALQQEESSIAAASGNEGQEKDDGDTSAGDVGRGQASEHRRAASERPDEDSTTTSVDGQPEDRGLFWSWPNEDSSESGLENRFLSRVVSGGDTTPRDALLADSTDMPIPCSTALTPAVGLSLCVPRRRGRGRHEEDSDVEEGANGVVAPPRLGRRARVWNRLRGRRAAEHGGRVATQEQQLQAADNEPQRVATGAGPATGHEDVGAVGTDADDELSLGSSWENLGDSSPSWNMGIPVEDGRALAPRSSQSGDAEDLDFLIDLVPSPESLVEDPPTSLATSSPAIKTTVLPSDDVPVAAEGVVGPATASSSKNASPAAWLPGYLAALKQALDSNPWRAIVPAPAGITGLLFEREFVLPPPENRGLDFGKWPPPGPWDLATLDPDLISHITADTPLSQTMDIPIPEYSRFQSLLRLMSCRGRGV